MTDRLRQLVHVESPSGDLAALADCADLLVGWFDRVLGRPVARIEGHLLWEAAEPRVLILGHYDTVWPVGTLAEIPFVVVNGLARGPGVFDMKAGIVQALGALELLGDTDRVSVLWTCDEEVGSPTSRRLIEQQARRAGAVLVCEPSADGGAVKIARKGTAGYELTIAGRAAHAGLEPELGVNATVELAHQILALADTASIHAGTTVTPTVISGGTTSNTVPEYATVHVDVRAWTRAELERVDKEIRMLEPVLDGANLTVLGGPNRYPFEPSVAMDLLVQAQAVAADLGFGALAGVRSGGGSDANFTAALGIPTLCGFGAVGAHPHGRNEQVQVDAMPSRAALLAGLIERICAGTATATNRA